MGGKNEDVVQSTKKDKSGVVVQGSKVKSPARYDQLVEVNQKIRFHESKGEVHFHADDDGLKVAIPVADWHAAWADVKAGNPYQYIDSKNETVLKLRTGILNGKHDVTIEVARAGPIGSTYAALDKFTG